jgi:monoamine oxidase
MPPAAGASPVLFEASNRWGGRMFTVYDFYKGMFIELGGEFVDTNHEDLQKLAGELGVGLERLYSEGDGSDLYFFKGAFHTPNDMIDPAKKTGAFVPIAKQIAADAKKLTDKSDNWTSHARKLDQMSLKAYLQQSPQDVAEDGRQPRSERRDVLVLDHLSLHARQLFERQGWAIYHDVGGSIGTRPAWSLAICR